MKSVSDIRVMIFLLLSLFAEFMLDINENNDDVGMPRRPFCLSVLSAPKGTTHAGYYLC